MVWDRVYGGSYNGNFSQIHFVLSKCLQLVWPSGLFQNVPSSVRSSASFPLKPSWSPGKFWTHIPDVSPCNNFGYCGWKYSLQNENHSWGNSDMVLWHLFKIEKNEFFKELEKELKAKSMSLRLRTYLAVLSPLSAIWKRFPVLSACLKEKLMLSKLVCS